jgi:phage terminase small subunit
MGENVVVRLGGSDDLMKLTAKQESFVREYLIDLNATQAAIRAGYSEATAKEMGYENLTKPHIKGKIDKAINERSEKLQISAEYVLSSLKEVAERCMQATPVYDSDGEPTGEYRFEHSGANKALELLGKHLKLFTDKVEQSGETTHNIKSETDLSKLPVEELKKIEAILSKAADTE